ncbi:hypothetical protein [Actinocrispum wychmicini]|uniref:Uncharacterized protein n=1 Tax=Actinocrispum wychmicini TaxID=1213861 RepID=A0A4R2IIU9_9PSEU|nr:hypothetical protein [Actinocrispum wychmicini]TCO43739.1 hypothetical protein EV192_1282 [Actinocrispum wychmicini]
MTQNFTTDARYTLASGCPITTDPHPVDQNVDVVIGAEHTTGDAVRLALPDYATCYRLADAMYQAAYYFDQMTMEPDDTTDPALSRVDTGSCVGTLGMR